MLIDLGKRITNLLHFLKPSFNDDCIRFYQNHYWLWCLRVRRIRCLFGLHKWVEVAKHIGAYCDNCPMDKDADGTTHLVDTGK